MQYVGGKQKSGGSQIATLFNTMIVKHGLTTYSEPFCGGLSVTQRIRAKHRHASDACVALITLYQEIQKGWNPPTSLTKEQWLDLKVANDPQDPLTAFAGFGCSIFGSWFDSFVPRSKRTGDNYVSSATAAAESLLNKMSKCRDVNFTSGDYQSVITGEIIYCDPPYKNTREYEAVGSFDTDRFWKWAREVSSHRLLAVSEQQAPEDFVPVKTFYIQSRIAVNSGKQRVEHLYVHDTQEKQWRVSK